MNRSLLLLAMVPALGAQSVDIYSEFQRPDPYGGIVAPDRSPSPREILSPGVARNGWASFHVAVRMPPNNSYLLYVMTNPRDACRVEMYKEHFVETKAGWIPDRLTPLQRLPDYGFMPDPDDGVPDQNTRVYLLDLWVPPDSGIGRFRLEVQLKTGTWDIRPMEIRVLDVKIPEVTEPKETAALPQVEAPIDWSASSALFEARACPAPDTVRAIVCRNAQQDMALARKVAKPGTVLGWWWSFNMPRVLGAEWWLRMRDLLYATAKL